LITYNFYYVSYGCKCFTLTYNESLQISELNSALFSDGIGLFALKVSFTVRRLLFLYLHIWQNVRLVRHGVTVDAVYVCMWRL